MKLQLLIALSACVAYCMSQTSSDTSAPLRTDFGYAGRAFQFWLWTDVIRAWKQQCDKYRNNENKNTTTEMETTSEADSIADANAIQTRITGGNLAEPNMLPFQAGLLLLQPPVVIQCGGALISTQYVLTAAHCLYGTTRARVFFGSLDYANEQTATVVRDVNASDFRIYESYRMRLANDDIGLIYLREAVPLSESVQIIPLARSFMTQMLLEGETVTASGWGRTSDNATVTTDPRNLKLNYVDAPVVPQQECACYYLPGLVQLRQHICAAGAGGRGSCDGDSGGPLTFYYNNVSYLVGVTAFGSAGGCEIGFPTVYMRVTSYLGWISQLTGIKID